MSKPGHSHDPLRRVAAGVAAAGAAAASYMTCEARWIECRQQDLAVSGLPTAWWGLTVLHISDVHAGSYDGNERNLQKVVDWAEPLSPDLVLLTGDVLGLPKGSDACLRLLGHLRPTLGTYAVTGNHEYGLSKGPLAKPRYTHHLWQQAGITLLSDSCAALPAREGSTIMLCGADYLTGGYGLLHPAAPTPDLARAPDPASPGAPASPVAPASFPILLIHEPPQSDSPLIELFPLAFAGHTHGGQLRLPGPSGLRPPHKPDFEHLSGVHAWGQGKIVITRGVGTGFLPFRLFARPEATLWRLV